MASSATGEYSYFSLTKTSSAAAGEVPKAQHLVFEVSGAHQNILTADLQNFTLSLIRTRLPLHTVPVIVQPAAASPSRWRVGFSLSAADNTLVDPAVPAASRLFMADVPFLTSFGADGGGDIGAIPNAYYSISQIVAAVNRGLSEAWADATLDPGFINATFLNGYGAGAGRAVLNNPPFLRLLDGSSSLAMMLPRYDLRNAVAPDPGATLAYYSATPTGAELDAIAVAANIPPERARHNINIVFSESLANSVFAQFGFQRFLPSSIAAPPGTVGTAPLCRLIANLNESTLIRTPDIVSPANTELVYYQVVSDSPNLQNISSLVKIFLTITGISIANDSVADVTKEQKLVSAVPVLTDVTVALDPQIGRSAVYLSPAAMTRQINIRDGVKNLRDVRVAAYYQIFDPDQGIVSYPLLLPPSQFAEIRLAFTRKLSRDLMQDDE
jgi:hypothetical protein